MKNDLLGAPWERLLYDNIKIMDKLNIKVLFVISVTLVVLGAWHLWPQNIPTEYKIESYSEEIENIKATGNLDEQVKWYTRLIDRMGPLEAQEMLYRSGLPFTGETHLLNHTAGDRIYEIYGKRGLVYCRDYFLSACYHGFLIRLINDGGIDAVAQAAEECKSESWPVYVQCAHAIGHGFLAEAGYKNLPDALEMCDLVQEEEGDFPEFNCYDGVFMENIWAVHETGEPSSDRWVKEKDPFYPCNDSRIEEKYLRGCWSNQAAVMYRVFEGDLEKIGSECLKVEDKILRETCFNGTARQIHPITGGNADKVFEMCALMPREWENYCLITIASADFSVGGRELPFEMCNRMNRENRGDECYSKLLGNIDIYIKDKKEHTFWCGKIENLKYQVKCI